MFLVQRIDCTMGVLFPESIDSYVYDDIIQAYQKYDELLKEEDNYYEHHVWEVQEREAYENSEFDFGISFTYQDCDWGIEIKFSEIPG